MKIPNSELRKSIELQFNYDRRKFIFWAFNSTYLGIALFQIFSDVNIEGGNNPSLCIDAEFFEKIHQECPSVIYSSLIALVISHFIQVIASITGYFGIDQKSRKINFAYQFLLLSSYIYQFIVSMILISKYSMLNITPFRATQSEFLMLLIVFPIVQGIICFFSFTQFRKATYENYLATEHKEQLLENYHEITRDLIKQIIIT